MNNRSKLYGTKYQSHSNTQWGAEQCSQKSDWP